MYTIATPEEFKANVSALDAFPGFLCWCLYCDMHKTFAAYVRYNWMSLHHMSGSRCLICLIDQPSSNADPYWQDIEKNPSTAPIYKSRPFDRTHHLKIADMMGIPYASLPCIVFFESPYSNEHFIIPFSGAWSEDILTEYFAGIFDRVRDVWNQSPFSGEVNVPIDRIPAVRQDCMLQLTPLLRRLRLVSAVKRIASPANLIGIAQAAASLK